MAKPQRLAAIDVGSNTVHLFLANREPGKPPAPVARRREFVQLGLDVADTGRVGEERLRMAGRALRRQVAEARRNGAKTIAVAATQALRAASNGVDCARRLAAQAQVDSVHILPPRVEAQLAFDGAGLTLPAGSPLLLLDIGGASSQLASGLAGGRCANHSLAIGSGTVSRLADGDPPTSQAWRKMEHRVAAAIPELLPPPAGVLALGTGGTITNLPRLLGRPKGSVLTPTDIEQLIDIFREVPSQVLGDRCAVDAERVRLCWGGALILAQMMDLLELGRLRASERGLRDGMVEALALRGSDWWLLNGSGTAPAPTSDPQHLAEELAAGRA